MTPRSLLTSPPGALFLLVLAWLVVVPLFQIQPRYLPPLGSVLAEAVLLWPDLVAGFWRTLLATVLGFLAGAVFGITCGVVFAHVRVLERALFPLFVALQSVPVIAFGAIVVIWFGNTILSKVVIALYLAFFPVAVNTLRGLSSVDAQRVALMSSFGASRWRIFRMLTLPSAAPVIMTGLKLAISLSLAGTIVGEWFGDTVGLGVLLLQALYFEQVTRIWVLIVACGLLGALLYGVLILFERRFVWWLPE